MTAPFAAAPAVVKRYAAALFQLAVEKDQLAALAAPMAALRQVTAEEDLQTLLNDPRFSLSRRKALAKAVAGAVKAPALLEGTLDLMARNQRLEFVPALAQEYTRLQDAAAGIVHVRLESAQPLTDTQRIQLRVMLKAYIASKDVKLDEARDYALKGGFRAFWGSKVWDASVRGRLLRLEAELKSLKF